MWKKKLRHKKQQFILIGIILIFATAIFTGCISFTLETNKSSSDYYKPENCPDLFFLILGEEMEQYILDDKSQMQSINAVFYQPAKVIEENFTYKGKKLPKFAMSIMAMENYKEVPWYMGIVEGDKEVARPGDDEIWISAVYAKDNSIILGDTVLFGGSSEKELRVSALFNTAVSPSGLMGIYPFYVNQTTLDSMEGKPGTYITFSLKDGLENADIFKKSLPEEFYKNIVYDLDRSGMVLSFSTASSFFGGIGTLASLVIFIVSVILIRFMLRATLIREYRTIGIYKSLGFTSREIKYFYLKCYLLTGIISLPLGVLLGVPISYLLGSITFQYMGTYQVSYITPLLGILIIMLLLGILIINVDVTLKNIKKITPVDALNIGMTSSKVKLKKSIIIYAASPLSMAINNIFKRKGMSIMITVILTVSFYLTLFFTCINYTCSNLEKNIDEWFGLPKSDCIVETKITKEMKTYLEDNDKIKSAGYADFNVQIQNMKCNDKDLDLTNSTVFAYNTFDETILDFHYNSGRPPQNPSEIGLSDSQLKDLGLKVGDYINLTIGDNTGEYLISGKFFSWYRGGKNFQVLGDELKRSNITYSEQTGFICLKDKSSYEQFKKEFEAKFPNVQVEKISPSLKTATDSIVELASPITGILVGVFVLFSLLNIINLLLMNNIENRRQFGILKALGFTNRYILLQSIANIALLSCGGALLAQIIHSTLSRPFFYTVCGVNAMKNPFLLNIIVTLSVIIIILFMTLMFSLPLKKIVPTDLMEE